MPDETITVLILNSVKRVRSIKVNRARIRFAIFLVSTFCAVFILSLGANLYLFQQNQNFSSQLASIQKEGQEGDNPLYDKAGDADGTAISLRGQGTESADSSAGAVQGLSGREPGGEDIHARDFNSDRVTIENLKSTRTLNDMELNVSFNIVNTLPAGSSGAREAVSGYIVIVAKTSDAAVPYVSWPLVQLDDDGTPMNFVRGNRFTIQYLRPVEGKMLLNDPAESFEYYRIFVYSRAGELLMLKTNSIGR